VAFRNDISVSFHESPRIIEIAAPSIVLTIQDLYDTLRELEDDLLNMDDKQTIIAAGKDTLGGGVEVGITATLQNAQVAFEGRTTALSSGSHTGATSTSILIDSTATFIADGVTRGDVVHNLTDRSSTSVISVDSETQLTLRLLTGGTGNDWESGDVYDVFDVVQCNISGGNLVAVDAVGADLDPIFPTSYTQVVLTGSTSATISSQSQATLDVIRDNVGARKDMDFTGDDALGWQEVIFDDLGVETGRFDLFDEAGVRINGTVAAFILRGGMIASRRPS